MKTFPTLEKAIEAAAKVGHNPQEAAKIIAEHYNYIKRVYPGASAKKVVHIAYILD